MSDTKTQLQWVKDRLLYDGEVSRNGALQNYITRLGARINDLKNENWDIKGEWRKYDKGRDFVYVLIKSPLTKTVYNVVGLDKQITTYA